MILENIKEELERIRIELRWSVLQLSTNCSLSYNALRKIIDGHTKNIREDTLSKIEEGTGYKAEIDGNRIIFYSKDEYYAKAKYKTETSDANLYKPIPLTEKDEAVIKMMGLTPDMVRRLQYIPLLREVPTTRQNLKQQFVNLRIGTVMTTYTGENEMLFAVEMQDDSMGDVIKKGSSVVADPDQTLKEGDISAVKYNDKNHVGYYHEQEDVIILHGTGKTPPLLIPKAQEIAIFRVVQSINTY